MAQAVTAEHVKLLSMLLERYRDGAGNTVEENSSVFSLIRMCLQCFDTVGWAAGRASGS